VNHVMLTQLSHSNYTYQSHSSALKQNNSHQIAKNGEVESNQSVDSNDQADLKAHQSLSEKFNVDELVKNLYDQLASKVNLRSKGDAQAQDALWKEAKEGIAQGFEEAKDVIKAFGQMDDTLNDKINDAQSTLFERIDQQQQVQAFNQVESSFAHKEQKNFALELTTREGDTVRLLFDQSQHVKARENAYGMDFSQMDMEQFRLDVVGDLNEQELEDIRSLFQDVSKLSQAFYSGDMDQAFDLASQLNINDSTLHTMDLNLTSMSTTTSQTTALLPKQAIEQYQQIQPQNDSIEKYIAKPVAAQMLEFLEHFDQSLEQKGLPNLNQWMTQVQAVNEAFIGMFEQSSRDLWPNSISKLDSLF